MAVRSILLWNVTFYVCRRILLPPVRAHQRDPPLVHLSNRLLPINQIVPPSDLPLHPLPQPGAVLQDLLTIPAMGSKTSHASGCPAEWIARAASLFALPDANQYCPPHRALEHADHRLATLES